uniref:Uncharacterized protein n=1 Tax=Amphimedon queenslandica TaxID=400682 RepID=A0A1X7SQX3_AMPQE
MSTLLLLLFSCAIYKSVGGSRSRSRSDYFENIVLKFNFNVTVMNVTGNCAHPEGIVTLNISSSHNTQPEPALVSYNISAASKQQSVDFVIKDKNQNLRFTWTDTSACCPVTIINGTVRSDTEEETLIICNKMSWQSSSTSVKFQKNGNKLASYPVDHSGTGNKGCRSVSVNTGLPTCMIATSISPSLTESSSTINVDLYASLPNTSVLLPESSVSMYAASSSISTVSMHTVSLPESSISTVSMHTVSLPESSISAESMHTVSLPESSISTVSMHTVSLPESSISTVSMPAVIPTIPMHTSKSSSKSRSATQAPLISVLSMSTTSFLPTVSSLTYPSPSSPVYMYCSKIDQWKATKPRVRANGTCHKGTFNG